ncbi:cytochrome C oxidase subunit IV family protein [Paenibacillus sp. PR3]|uniref:Cytochrome C oxidase subunit IV family protein n=1 Tax=Paenibacillus terricola TaxID=2763503 RepID=A0ABR8N4N4_9BACL|nr:cytochrome C oxidase subunit IV family protein [Paenibacillus terricola]MBD3922372.1 cytochrome C oxidase subunit IV family protein [Paenibacillus terricola]
MAAVNHSATEETKKRHKHEGPQKHIVAYIMSLILTLIAFAAVIAGEVNTSFIIFILLMMAGLQVFVQMGFWMHMKDKGHTYAIIGILGGIFIAGTMIIMAEFWAWW